MTESPWDRWMGEVPQKLISPFPSPITAPGLEFSVWIKTGDTEIKRRFTHMIDIDHYLTIFDRDWAALEIRAAKLPKDRAIDDAWFEITTWFERPGVELQDSAETMDLETGRAFIRMVFEAWAKVDGS